MIGLGERQGELERALAAWKPGIRWSVSGGQRVDAFDFDVGVQGEVGDRVVSRSRVLEPGRGEVALALAVSEMAKEIAAELEPEFIDWTAVA